MISPSIIEQSIIGYLQERLQISVVAYPNDPANYFLREKDGEILVRYEGSSFNENDLDRYYPLRTMSVELILIHRSLRDEDGLYDKAEAIKQNLLTLEIEGIESIAIEREDMLGENEGIWQMGIKVKVNTYLEIKKILCHYQKLV